MLLGDLTATWALFASQMLVSNDCGFATAATLLATHTV